MTPFSLDPTARIVLVDDHAVVRRGLRQILEREPGFHVCAEGGSLADGLGAVERLDPDLLVTDLSLEGRGGLELVGLVHRYHPDLPILVVSMHDETLFAHRALAAGARGYVTKQRAEHDVVQAARAVLAGQTFLGGETGRALAGGGEPVVDPVQALSDREFEVFLYLGEGYTPRHIADALCLSVSTVEAYRERMKDKLGVESSPMLLRYAVRWCKDRAVS